MKRLSIISGVLFLCTSLMAANKITGKIIDESNNQHIEYANVSLLTQDSTFITGVATDNGGGFLLKEVNDGDYILCISCVGYEKLLSLHPQPASQPESGRTALITRQCNAGRCYRHSQPHHQKRPTGKLSSRPKCRLKPLPTEFPY